MTGMKDVNLQSLIWKNQVLSGWHLNVISSVEASKHVNIWGKNLNLELINLMQIPNAQNVVCCE